MEARNIQRDNFHFLQGDEVEGTIVPIDVRALKGESVRMSLDVHNGDKSRVERKVVLLALIWCKIVLHVISFILSFIQSQ